MSFGKNLTVMIFAPFVFAISGLLWFRDVRFPHDQGNPTRGLLDAARPAGPTKAGANVAGVTACTVAGASRQTSCDGAGLAATRRRSGRASTGEDIRAKNLKGI